MDRAEHLLPAGRPALRGVAGAGPGRVAAGWYPVSPAVVGAPAAGEGLRTDAQRIGHRRRPKRRGLHVRSGRGGEHEQRGRGGVDALGVGRDGQVHFGLAAGAARPCLAGDVDLSERVDASGRGTKRDELQWRS